MSTRYANALADALTDAIAEEVMGMDTDPIVESVLESMRCGEFVTEQDLTYAIESQVEEYILNNDLMSKYDIERLVHDTLTDQGEILSPEDIQYRIDYAIEQARFTTRFKQAWAGFKRAFSMRRG